MAVSAGLKATFQFLSKTSNEATVEVLLAALDCPHPDTREGALRALLERPSPAGHLEVFWRLPTFDQQSRAIVQQRPDRLVSAAGDAVRSPDPQVCAAACDAVLTYRLYESLPALGAALSAAGQASAGCLAETILKLTDLFYAELCAPDKQPRRKDIDTLRQRLTSTLEEAVGKFSRHRRKEVIEALLSIAKPQNATFRFLLQQPDAEASAAMIDVLSQSPRGGVLRLLLGFLEEPLMPQAVKRILAGRSDVKFVENLMLSVGPKPSKTVAETLAQIDGFAWASPQAGVLAELSEPAQECAVGALMASAVRADARREAVGWLLLQGKPQGRRAAAKALADFEGAEANALVVQALGDVDPIVRARALKQLRPRGIPGALSLLIRMIDSPQDDVRQALREALPEFSLRRFLDNFESLDSTMRAAAGQAVRKIDPEAAAQLAGEMEHLSPVRRRRAVVAADAMNVVRELEPQVIQLLADEDHMVRIAAAKALADCGTKPSWEALRDALLDRSVIVREAAEQSLEQISCVLLPGTERQDAKAEQVQR